MYFSPVSISGKYNVLSPAFQAAYRWLTEGHPEQLAPGSYPVCEGVIAQVQEYQTILPEEGAFETHDENFDIQYVISGRELFGVCKRSELTLDRSEPERDIAFYREPEVCGYVPLLPGDLIVVSPEDAHKPRLQVDGPEFVRKVVLKVRVNTEGTTI